MKSKNRILSVTIAASLLVSTLLQANDRPNVLFISIDDLNDWVGPLGGNAQSKTPNMDRLAKRGMFFENAHSPAMLCNPSRTAIMLGLHPSTTGIFGNGTDWRTLESLTGKRSLPRYFRDAGYQTFGAGKLFHASTFAPQSYFGYNDTTAWEDFFPSLERQLPDEIKPHAQPANGGDQLTFDWAPVAALDSAIGDGQVVTWSIEKILAPGDGPRFNAVGIYRPHEPWYVPQKYFDLHPLADIELPAILADDLDDLPAAATMVRGPAARRSPADIHNWILEDETHTRWKEGVQAYLASISFADAMLGRVIDALDQSGRADDTIIILWSDHGFHLGEKNRWRKGTLWSESHRVPFLVVAPGVTTPGSSSRSPVTTLDIYSTLAELVGLEVPGHVQGESLLPLLKDPSHRPDRAVVSTSSFKNHVVSGERFHYLRYADGSEELYDAENDPHEWTNLASDPAYQKHITRLAQWLPQHDAPMIGGPPRGRRGPQGPGGERAQAGPRGEGPPPGPPGRGGRRPGGGSGARPDRGN